MDLGKIIEREGMYLAARTANARGDSILAQNFYKRAILLYSREFLFEIAAMIALEAGMRKEAESRYKLRNLTHLVYAPQH